MKRILILAAFAVTGSASANMILNGSFEFNSAAINEYNLTNSAFSLLVSGVTGFGDSDEIDLMNSNEYGPTASDGIWKLGLHSKRDIAAVDAFSFDLNSGIVSGTEYVISFDAANVDDFDPNNGPIQIGISNSANDFGTLVFSGTGGVDNWISLSGSFVANSDATYLTVRNDPSVSASWVHVDNFNLQAVPEPSSLLALGLLGLGLLARRKRG
ncbi:MAG TPA: PEP-CTERM sorting domain-containing protein [Fimbriimonadaceae bacterium]|nr:PEP-CTERM sorting domain-containing protein [Fimbriimonadaceae bacterium]